MRVQCNQGLTRKHLWQVSYTLAFQNGQVFKTTGRVCSLQGTGCVTPLGSVLLRVHRSSSRRSRIFLSCAWQGEREGAQQQPYQRTHTAAFTNKSVVCTDSNANTHTRRAQAPEQEMVRYYQQQMQQKRAVTAAAEKHMNTQGTCSRHSKRTHYCAE
jgi:hypothetical protein